MERKVILTKQAFSSKQSRSARALLVQNFRQEKIDCDFIISNTLNMIGKIKEFEINDQHFVYFFTVNGFVKNLLDYQYGIVLLFVRLALAIYINFTVVMSGESSVCHKLVFDFLKKNFNEATALKIYGGSNKKLLKSNEPASVGAQRVDADKSKEVAVRSKKASSSSDTSSDSSSDEECIVANKIVQSMKKATNAPYAAKVENNSSDDSDTESSDGEAASKKIAVQQVPSLPGALASKSPGMKETNKKVAALNVSKALLLKRQMMAKQGESSDSSSSDSSDDETTVNTTAALNQKGKINMVAKKAVSKAEEESSSDESDVQTTPIKKAFVALKKPENLKSTPNKEEVKKLNKQQTHQLVVGKFNKAAMIQKAGKKVAASSDSSSSESSSSDEAAPLNKKSLNTVVQKKLPLHNKKDTSSSTDSSSSEDVETLKSVDQKAIALTSKTKAETDSSSESDSSSENPPPAKKQKQLNNRGIEPKHPPTVAGKNIFGKKEQSSDSDSTTSSSSEEEVELKKEVKMIPMISRIAALSSSAVQKAASSSESDTSTSSEDDLAAAKPITKKTTQSVVSSTLQNPKKTVRKSDTDTSDSSSSGDMDFIDQVTKDKAILSAAAFQTKKKLASVQKEEVSDSESKSSSDDSSSDDELKADDSSSSDDDVQENAKTTGKITAVAKGGGKSVPGLVNSKKRVRDDVSSSSDSDEEKLHESQAKKQKIQPSSLSSSHAQKKEETSDSSSTDSEKVELSNLKSKIITPMKHAKKNTNEKKMSSDSETSSSDEEETQASSGEKSLSKGDDSGKVLKKKRPAASDEMNKSFNKSQNDQSEKKKKKMNESGNTTNGYDEWGKKAYETFSTVKGKSFRKEKTKKKREPSPNCSPIPDALVQIAPKELGTVADGRWSEDHIKFVLIALVEMVCCLTESNPEKQKKLFCVLSQTLVELGVSSCNLSLDWISLINDPKALKLYLQMELCSWTLKDWMDERNAAVKSNCCNLLYANYRKTKTSPFDLVNADVNEIILRQLVEAIQYIHSQNVMHRDLKPSNVFLSGQKPQVLLGDFGLACQFLSPEIWSEQENNNFTKVEQQPQPTKQHSKAIGTSLYASPEQLKLSTYDNKAGIVSQLIQQQPALRPSAAELIRSGLFKSEQDVRRRPLAILPEADVPALRNAVSIRPENIVQSIKAPNVRHTYAICRCAYKPTVIFF
ncbi:Eukaryotic translation initiation factor 2-alpha kinase 1 [Trichinella patagoniensis]|uniref:non-specific serine/threonine protein kinase n=1 Tax=Trichinella patagoniensis TaxID=990121 RepID=A0A0V0ZS74_9BILA|nr:Eukaryotic translation initiation factor 2-alpha kinase 1 [Trichinella patagoniensis]